MAKKLLAALVLVASAGLPIAHAETPISRDADTVHGVASYYAHKFEGRRTASGETFRHAALTAAHATLPFGTVALITNLATGKWVVVRITDRLPHKKTLIDLTRTAAEELGMLRAGRIKVKLEVLEPSAAEKLSAREGVEYR